MQTKVQAYVQLADETSLKITGNYLDWLSFLTTASRLYKYPYHDQLMIYAQRPDASACAAYELWNGTMHRYIRRGAKGIALLNPTANGMRIRYVFDVSDTGTRADSRNVDVWQLTEAAEPAVRKMLAEEFSADASMRLAAQIDQLAERQALAYWNEHRRDILDSVDDSALSEYDDFAAGGILPKSSGGKHLGCHPDPMRTGAGAAAGGFSRGHGLEHARSRGGTGQGSQHDCRAGSPPDRKNCPKCGKEHGT